MTSRPRLFTEANYRNGFAALLLFAVLAVVFVGAGFPFPQGFGDASITAAIGYAMFDMVDQAAYQSESFLVAFEIIDFVLVAALVGAVMLARREDDESLTAALADGGRRLRGRGRGRGQGQGQGQGPADDADGGTDEEATGQAAAEAGATGGEV